MCILGHLATAATEKRQWIPAKECPCGDHSHDEDELHLSAAASEEREYETAERTASCCAAPYGGAAAVFDVGALFSTFPAHDFWLF